MARYHAENLPPSWGSRASWVVYPPQSERDAIPIYIYPTKAQAEAHCREQPQLVDRYGFELWYWMDFVEYNANPLTFAPGRIIVDMRNTKIRSVRMVRGRTGKPIYEHD